MIVDAAYAPPCVERPEVYLDERLQDLPARTELSGAEWQVLSDQLAGVRRQCASCRLLVDCLYRAVVDVDVFGYAACTTARDRQEIRSMLGIAVRSFAPEPAGVGRAGTGPVDHEAVLAARRAHPEDTFGQLAERLGCSLSTVKRHMRRAREQAVETTIERHRPSVEDVLDCFDRLDLSRSA